MTKKKIPAINPDTAPPSMEFKSEDFLASDAAKCAPLGGVNEYSVDTTAIMNLPIGPDNRRMKAFWISPRQIPIYRDYGVLPITVAQWKHYKLVGTSSSIEMGEDGFVYRDSRSVVAAWTMGERYEEIQKANSDAAERAMGARGFQESLSESDSYGLRHGVPHFTEDSFRSVNAPDSQPEFIPMPGRAKSAKVSLSGPKMVPKTESGETQTPATGG